MHHVFRNLWTHALNKTTLKCLFNSRQFIKQAFASFNAVKNDINVTFTCISNVISNITQIAVMWNLYVALLGTGILFLSYKICDVCMKNIYKFSNDWFSFKNAWEISHRETDMPILEINIFYKK